MNQPKTKREQLLSLQKRQGYLKYKVKTINRALSKLMVLSMKPRPEANNFQGLSYIATRTLIGLVSRLGKCQRDIHSTRANIVRIENEISLRGLKEKSSNPSFEVWVSVLYDLAAIEGLEDILAGNREDYRLQYSAGATVKDVLKVEASQFKNLKVNGRKIT